MKPRGYVWLVMAVMLMAAGCRKRQAPQPAEETTPTACLHLAARKGDLAQVQSLIAGGCDVNAPGVLHWAVEVNEKEIVELFLAHGADINVKNDNGETPLARLLPF